MIALHIVKSFKYAVIALLIVSCKFSYLSAAAGDAEISLSKSISEIDRYAENTWEHRKALALLQEALEIHPENDELLWRVSRSYADSAEALQKKDDADEDTIVSLYTTASEYADKAIEANPQNSMAYTRRAIATGQIALYKGIWDAIDLVRQTRDAVERALELDDRNATAHFVYARSHAEVSRRPKLVRMPLGLGWARIKTALEHFEKAIELRPESIRFRLDAARAFQREKNYEEARKILEPVADLDIFAQFDHLYKEEALVLLADLQDK